MNTILKYLKNSDYVVCNFEGPATNESNFLRPNVQVASPVNSIAYLIKRNMKTFNLANNHIFDCGSKGFIDNISMSEFIKGIKVFMEFQYPPTYGKKIN